MTKREKKYHIFKKAAKYINSRIFALKRETLSNLWEFGIAGTNVFLDESSNVRVNPLTFDECMDLKDKLPIEGITIVTL